MNCPPLLCRVAADIVYCFFLRPEDRVRVDLFFVALLVALLVALFLALFLALCFFTGVLARVFFLVEAALVLLDPVLWVKALSLSTASAPGW